MKMVEEQIAENAKTQVDKPMYCPMSFANDYVFNHGPKECTPDCAWAVIHHGIYECCISENTGIPQDYRNTRPLKDDTE